VGEENRLEGLLQFHVLAGDDVLVGENDALPGGHKWADYTMKSIEARRKANYRELLRKGYGVSLPFG